MDRYIAFSEDECRNCWAVRLCGLCFTSVLCDDKFSVDRKQQYCDSERLLLDEGFKMYAEIMERNPHALDFISEMSFQ